MKTESNFVEHVPCEACGSSDGGALYDDGHTHCEKSMILKTCKICGKEKDLSLFSPHGKSKKGTVVYTPTCKECRTKQGREERTQYLTKTCEGCGVSWRRGNGETKKTKTLCPTCYPLYRAAFQLVANAKHRATKKGLEYDIDVDFIYDILKGGKCARTGIEFSLGYNGKSFKDRNAYTPSIDKIDPTKGYTKDNVQVVCWWYNLSKSNFSDQTVLELCKKLVNHTSLNT